MRKVFQIIPGQSKRSQYEWYVVLTECGMWAYTTSKKINVGDEVELEYRNKEFKYYIKTK